MNSDSTLKARTRFHLWFLQPKEWRKDLFAFSGSAPVKRKTAAQLQKELDAANARIAELEAEVAAQGMIMV